jgi:hypothetical protein
MPKRTIKMWLTRDKKRFDDSRPMILLWAEQLPQLVSHSGWWERVDFNAVEPDEKWCKAVFGKIPAPGQLIELTVTMEGKVVD